MEQKDKDCILHIEALCSPKPWKWDLFASGVSSGSLGYQVLEHSSEGVLGFLCISDLGIDIEIQNLAIHPNWQRKGFASHLLDYAIEQGKKKKKERILLEVRENNLLAIRLYHKYLFKLDAKRKGYYDQGAVDAHLMSLNLLGL
jgi:ribosomal-protein-alanine N-acetyltransferase